MDNNHVKINVKNIILLVKSKMKNIFKECDKVRLAGYRSV